MLGGLAALGLALVIAQTPSPTEKPAPIEYPCKISLGKCYVTLPLAGNTYSFLIDTGNDQSYLTGRARKAVLASNESLALKIGQVSLSAIELTKLSKFSANTIDGADGVLGMDVLSKLVFGVDYLNDKFYVWPPDMDLTAFIGWAGTSRPFMGLVLTTMEDDNRFYVSSDYGWLCLDTGSPTILLPSEPEKEKDFLKTDVGGALSLFNTKLPNTNLFIAPRVIVEGLAATCIPVFVSTELTKDDGGAIGTSLFSSKVLLDGPGKMFYLVGEDPTYEFDLTMQFLTLGHASLHNGKYSLPLDAVDFKGHPPKDPWAEIVQIGKVKVSDLQADFAKHDPALPGLLRDLVNGLDKGMDAEILIDGKLTSAMLGGN